MFCQGLQQKTERNQESAPSELVGEGRGRRDTPKPVTPWDLCTALSTESCTLNNHPGLIYVPGWPLGMLGLLAPYLK